jgi:large subunit ribosomal protein L15
MQLIKVVKRGKRVGRGIGSRGAKSGRGMKGQRSRAGSHQKAGFEGGQTPLYMRLPKGRGMKQTFASRVKKPAAVSTKTLNRFAKGAQVDLKELMARGIVPRKTKQLKLIGGGEVKMAIHAKVQAATKAAQAAVEKAGGTVEIIS